MATNVNVTRKENENNVSLIRRFTRKVQGSGVLPRVRSIRYSLRKPSSYVGKKRKLKSLAKKEEITQLIKLGKLPETYGQKRRR